MNAHHSKSAPYYTRFPRLLWRALRAFFSDNVSRLGAALAFYTTVAVAPLLVLTLVVAGFFFGGEEAARERVLGEIENLAGRQAGAAISAVQSPADTPAGRVAAVVGSVTLLFGGFGVFYHLQGALNEIWHIPPPREIDWWRTLLKRLFSMAMVLVTGFLLLVSLIASAFLSWLSETTVERLELPPLVLQAINLILSLGMITLLLAVIFRLLPDTRVRWRQVWVGSALTAALFTAGKTALGFYLAHADVGSAYGAAGSIIVLLLWCYYAAQIIFFGAEFTRISHLSDGGRDFSKLDRPLRRDLSL
ncbi:MAG TPA: YihY/virulence factor BrkB family protein [Rariglobus sp.]|nr:YihY/virulence factor BrkB family protein [Rariglobus sp.]